MVSSPEPLIIVLLEITGLDDGAKLS